MDRHQFYTPVRLATFVVGLSIALTIALIPMEPAETLPQVGETALDDVRAREDVAFESAVLTDLARDAAGEDVAAFVTVDRGVERAQASALQALLMSISDIRGSSATEAERTAALAAVPGLPLSLRGQILVLSFTNAQWETARDEATTLLTESFAANIIESDLETLRSEIPNHVDPDLAPAVREVVVELVAPLIMPNVVIDDVATLAAREQARSIVSPVVCSFREGELVFPQGVEVTGADILARCDLPVSLLGVSFTAAETDAVATEALERLTPDSGGVPGDELIAVLIIAAACAVTLGAYLALTHPRAAASDRRLVLLGALIFLAAVAARWYFPAVLPEEQDKALELILPLAAVAVLATVLLETTLALVVATIVAALGGFAAMAFPDYDVTNMPSAEQALRPAVTFLFAGVAGVFASTRVERVTQYAVVGSVIGGTVFITGLAFWLFNDDRSTVALAWLALTALIATVVTGVVTVGAFTFLGSTFGVTTRLQLLEMAQLTQPLLRRLQEEAPGTFHHSQLVATMGERAAAQIDAHPLLVRVGAYYHDIGKLAQPHMYIENQGDEENPHDGVDPWESARVIQEHVRWGLELGRRHRLPERVRDFIPEHHGTRLVTYFYRKAAQLDPDVDPTGFTYEGPRPRSRETAIVMLADSCEAVVRSSHDRDPEQIDSLIDGVINERLAERQLDDSDMTLRDLRLVGESFKVTLRGVYHSRISYPEPTAAEQERLTRSPLPEDFTAPPEPVSDLPVDGSEAPEIAQPGPGASGSL